MSIHSLDHSSVAAGNGYKGYHIDDKGEVTEFYDHRSEETAPSSVASARQPLVNGTGYTSEDRPPRRRVKHRDAGCCTSCVNILEVIGNMPLATAFAFILCWIGTAMFIGGGWASLDGTLDLFLKYGPLEGNPARDPPPNYIYSPGAFASEFILADQQKLGNRVPDVFRSIKYSFYAIIPFMVIFTIVLACDNHFTSRAIRSKSRGCKTGSSGICLTSSLMFLTYLLILAWIFFLCFTTLGVYYYRISMLRCSDLNERGFTEGVHSSICIDLVQLGLIMFHNTNDRGYGKICGPGDNTRSFGKLDQYCGLYKSNPNEEIKNHDTPYYDVYQYMLVTFAGCLLIIISLLNFVMILTSNYNNLTRRLYRQRKGYATSAYTPSQPSVSAPPSMPARSVANSSPVVRRSQPPVVVPSQPLNYKSRRSSRDIELDYIIDDATTVDRRREVDSHMGVNYYYKH